MKPVNLAAQLAAAETELTCLRLMLAQATRSSVTSLICFLFSFIHTSKKAAQS